MYTPTKPLGFNQEQERYLTEELAQVERGQYDAREFFDMVPLSAEPTQTRPCMVVYANGTDWNPGSGQGIYRRNIANSAWVFVG